jgi:hypothetical protein
MELHFPLSRNTLVYCDNVSVVYLMSNPVKHQRMKHVEIDLYFVCDKVIIEKVCILHVPMPRWSDRQPLCTDPLGFSKSYPIYIHLLMQYNHLILTAHTFLQICPDTQGGFSNVEVITHGCKLDFPSLYIRLCLCVW